MVLGAERKLLRLAASSTYAQEHACEEGGLFYFIGNLVERDKANL